MHANYNIKGNCDQLYISYFSIEKIQYSNTRWCTTAVAKNTFPNIS